jgi:hypothetical protein
MNLFESPDIHKPLTTGTGLFETRKKLYRYRQSNDRYRRCKYCSHLRKIAAGSRNFYKCALIGITQSPATDIRLKSVCNRFSPNRENGQKRPIVNH